MAIKPILFNTEMVRAIQDGRKTQTRRICKGQGECNPVQVGYHPPFKPGDILWVRETWAWLSAAECGSFCFGPCMKYKGEYGCFVHKASLPRFSGTWKPSIHMPKEAARIFLRVKSVRCERLNDITLLDAMAEGCDGCACLHEFANPELGCTDCNNSGWIEPPEAEFAILWDSTIKPADRDWYGWDANPWVWVIEFERCEKPEGWCS